VALPAFAAVRRRLQRARGTHSAPAAFDRWLLLVGRSAANPPTAIAAAETDRQTDGRTPDRFVNPAPHIMLAASINAIADDDGNV